MKEPIKDKMNHTIGYIEEGVTTVYDAHQHEVGKIKRENGKWVAIDSHRNKVAVYDERTNTTTDSHYKSLGRGNMLVQALLAQAML